MQDGFQSPIPAPEQRPGVLRHPAVIAGATLVGIAALYLLFFRGPAPQPQIAQPRLPFGAAEQAYASKLVLSNFSMSEAENFLHQQVKYLDGDIANTGDRTLTALELTVEFRDDMKQLVLQETRPALIGPSPSFAPGQNAHFQISFDHVPPMWNMQMPVVRVSGIAFAATSR